MVGTAVSNIALVMGTQISFAQDLSSRNSTIRASKLIMISTFAECFIAYK